MMKFVLFALLVACAVASIPGGWSDADLDEEGVVEAVDQANRALGKQFKTPYHTKLFKVHKAQKQVVAGMNYKLDLIVGLTKCKKEEVKYEDIEDCEFQEGGTTYRKCQVILYHNLKGEYRLTSHACASVGKPE